MKKLEKIPEVLDLNYLTLKAKINEIIDFLNNSQQEEKKEECKHEFPLESNDYEIRVCGFCKKAIDRRGVDISTYPTKDQPSKPSIREELLRDRKILFQEKMRNFGIGMNKRIMLTNHLEETVDQILDLITKEILNSMLRKAYLVKGINAIEYRSLDMYEIEEVLNNIKK